MCDEACELMQSPIGDIILVANEEGLTECQFADCTKTSVKSSSGNKFTAQAARELKEYFEWYDSVAEWEEDTLKERREAIETCGTCEYYGKCIADHMRPFAKGDVCCGYKPLVEWWEENRERFSIKGQRQV